MKITMENYNDYKSLSKPILSIESIPIRIVTFIFEQRKMIIAIEKLHRLKWVLKPITNRNRLPSSYFCQKTMQNEDNYWKKNIVRKRVPNPISIRVVTLPSTDVSDRYRQKLRFPEISKTNQAMSLWNQLSTANSRRVVVDIVSWFVICLNDKEIRSLQTKFFFGDTEHYEAFLVVQYSWSLW